MATKEVDIEGIGRVSLYKRRGTRHVRLSLASSGQVRVTMPSWAPYQVGIEFAKTKATWILAQRQPAHVLEDGQPVGKAHHIHFMVINTPRVTTRVHRNMIYVGVPGGESVDSDKVQQAVRKASVRALRLEAEQLLPQRLASLAREHGFSYRSVNIKQMKGRWGSCSHQQDIVLNCFLMQLPWDLIDYVILHELTHTRVMAHGRPFWDELGKYAHNLPELRKRMREHQPVL
jgi:predicted metal-dependent hydrolase